MGLDYRISTIYSHFHIISVWILTNEQTISKDNFSTESLCHSSDPEVLSKLNAHYTLFTAVNTLLYTDLYEYILHTKMISPISILISPSNVHRSFPTCLFFQLFQQKSYMQLVFSHVCRIRRSFSTPSYDDLNNI
jgi:hypothetical protein